MTGLVSLWFCVPAHGRLGLTAICLRQLRRTCDSLAENGVQATAVVIADDENLDTARELGFATVCRDNRFTSRRFNDGFQLACDPKINPHPADYVVPFGSDDWVDWRLFCELPRRDTVLGFQRMSFVREDGRELSDRRLIYPGGAGIRIYPRMVLARMNYRPADEDRKRGCDMSTLINLKRQKPLRLEYRELDPRQIVDWKSSEENLNSYDDVTHRHRSSFLGDPFEVLTDIYPAEALAEMEAHYARSWEAALA